MSVAVVFFLARLFLKVFILLRPESCLYNSEINSLSPLPQYQIFLHLSFCAIDLYSSESCIVV